MGAAGPGRRQLQFQFFNVTDPCCFSGRNWAAYASAVRGRAQSLGGDFGVLPYEAPEHGFGAPIAQALLDDFLRETGRQGIMVERDGR